MGALGSLGIGLSVLFGVFLAVLAAEIYYMFCCRTRSSATANSRRVNSVQVVEAQAAAAAAAAASGAQLDGFARDAALVGSFGGYPGYSVQTDLVSKFFPPLSSDDGDCFHIPPLNSILFTITEETKEEMELLHGAGGYCTGIATAEQQISHSTEAAEPSKLHPDEKLDDFHGHVAATSVSSTSISFSASPDATPFMTPPSSPSSASDSSLSPSPTPSLATALSRFSVQSASSAANSASSSPLTAASRFSNYSASPTSTTGSPMTANGAGKFSVQSPSSLAGTPAAGLRLGLLSPVDSSPATQRSSVDSVGIYGDRGPLGVLFRRSYVSPATYSPLRPVGGSSYITDFRHALPFSPPNAEFFTRGG